MKLVIRASNAQIQRLLLELFFYFAAACVFASLCTAPGQLYLGRFYYIKDAGVAFSFVALAFLAVTRDDKVAMLVAAAGGALICIFAPALPKDPGVSIGLNIMWIMKWTVSAQLAILVLRERLYRPMTVIVAMLCAILCVDAAIGFWEIRNQGYFFDVSSLDDTATMRLEQFMDLIRIHSIHRSSGDFGNSMALGMILFGFLTLVCRRILLRLAAAGMCVICAYDLFFSTMRSFLVGATAAIIALTGAMLLRRWFARFFVHVMVALIAACLFFSYFNIIPMVEFVSKHILNNFQIGSVNSSYERLDSWDSVFGDVRASPIVMAIGGPLAAALGANAPASDICDNIYLWCFYHLGLGGLVAFVILVPLPLVTRTDGRVRALYFASATQLLVTGIFTDSFFYFSSVLLFFALGLILGELRAPVRYRGASRAPAAPPGDWPVIGGERVEILNTGRGEAR